MEPVRAGSAVPKMGCSRASLLEYHSELEEKGDRGDGLRQSACIAVGRRRPGATTGVPTLPLGLASCAVRGLQGRLRHARWTASHVDECECRAGLDLCILPARVRAAGPSVPGDATTDRSSDRREGLRSDPAQRAEGASAGARSGGNRAQAGKHLIPAAEFLALDLASQGIDRLTNGQRSSDWSIGFPRGTRFGEPRSCRGSPPAGTACSSWRTAPWRRGKCWRPF